MLKTDIHTLPTDIDITPSMCIDNSTLFPPILTLSYLDTTTTSLLIPLNYVLLNFYGVFWHTSKDNDRQSDSHTVVDGLELTPDC